MRNLKIEVCRFKFQHPESFTAACSVAKVQVCQTTTASSWHTNMHISFPPCSHDESNVEVFSQRVGVQLEDWGASEETKLLAGCRPRSEGSSYNQTRCISLLFNLPDACSSVSSVSLCVSSFCPSFRPSALYCALMRHNWTQPLDPVCRISYSSKQHLKWPIRWKKSLSTAQWWRKWTPVLVSVKNNRK